MKHALLLTTKDNKFLLGSTTSKASLENYAKTNNTTLSLVTTNTTPLSITQIVNSLNDTSTLPSNPPTHKTIDTLITPQTPKGPKAFTIVKKENYDNLLEQAQKVKDHISQELINGKEVSLNSVKDWATKNNIPLSKGGLSRHLQKALDQAVSQGYSKIKTGRSYKITK